MRVHFIFVCGSGVSQMAVLMKEQGHNITGSDTDIYPPVSTFLEKSGIQIQKLSEENITPDIDLVVLGGSAFIKVVNNKNIEYEKAKELKLKIIGWDELVGQELSSKITIDVVGTYGKSTTTALIAWILKQANLNPSYMVGAVSGALGTSVQKGSGEISVFEGDEHPLLHFHEGGKFMYHNATHALITSAKWDHINVFKTEKEYIQNYINFVKTLSGFIVANFDGENVFKVINEYDIPVIFYSNNINSLEKFKKLSNSNYKGLYYLSSQPEFSDNTKFNVSYSGQDSMNEVFESPLIGIHNIQNVIGAIALLKSLNIDTGIIKKSILNFNNVKRRLEIIGKTSKGAIIIDDLAHSPIKAQETLKALRTKYKNNKIYVVFDAHSSLLKQKEVLSWMDNVFNDAYQVIIPKVTVQKQIPEKDRIYGKDLVEAIARTKSNVIYLPIDEDIVNTLNESTNQNDIIVFMSSGNWRNIITDLISKNT